MAESKNWGRGEKVIVKSSLIGAAASLITAIAANAVLAGLIAGEHLSESAMGYGSLVVLLLSSAAGAVISIKTAQCKQLIVSALSGLVYFLCLLLITVIFFGGAFQGIPVTAAVVAGGSICSALVMPGARQKAHKGIKKKKHR